MADPYAQWFRASTPYIRAHRGRAFVVMLGGDALASAELPGIVHDLALLNVLGVRLVVVHGAAAPASTSLAGVARTRLEALFSTGIPQSPLRNRHISLVGGNLVTARPLGIVDGVDQRDAGLPRRIHGQAIRDLLDAGHVVLVSPIGFSPTGATYVLEPETLAVAVAAELGADKLIVYDAKSRVAERGDLTTAELARLLADGDFGPDTRRRLDALADACRQGVARCHLVGFDDDGVLLRELFTAEGAGTQVSDGDYRVIRRAAPSDAGGIMELIRPLAATGELVERLPSQIERDIEHFFVAELDGQLRGCCALLPLGSRQGEPMAELACLVGGNALGSRLLATVEEAAREAGCKCLFALTTRASDWFLERGFAQASVQDLPAEREARYDSERNSEVFVKAL